MSKNIEYPHGPNSYIAEISFGLVVIYLASQDALEVMRVTESLTHLLTYSLTEWALALTLLM